MSPFSSLIEQLDLPPLRRARTTTLQLNIGKKCNLACRHCHVESGPRRTEAMDRRGADRVLELLEANPQVATLDITGGAPELNPHFRHVVRGARALGRRVIDRCNLTVLRIPGQEDTAEFLAGLGVDIVASLPCYTRETVEQQRGRGVFGESIKVLLELNRLGYGKTGSRGRAEATAYAFTRGLAASQYVWVFSAKQRRVAPSSWSVAPSRDTCTASIEWVFSRISSGGSQGTLLAVG